MSMMLLAFDPVTGDAVLAADRHHYDITDDGRVVSYGLSDDKVHVVNERLLVTAVGDFATIAREVQTLSGPWAPRELAQSLVGRLGAYPPGQQRLSVLVLGADDRGTVGYLVTDMPRQDRPSTASELTHRTAEDPVWPYWMHEFRSFWPPSMFALPHAEGLSQRLAGLSSCPLAERARKAIEFTSEATDAISREATVWTLAVQGLARRSVS